MIINYRIRNPADADRNARLFAAADLNSDVLVNVLPERFLVVDTEADENGSNEDPEWVFGNYRRRTDLPTEDTGWLETRYLGAEEPDAPMPAMDEGLFVRTCARNEMKSAANDAEDANVVLADYLIALAVLESGLAEFDTQLPGTDATGPYQHTSDEWAAFLAVNADGQFTQTHRQIPLFHVACAAFIGRRDWDRMSELYKADNTGGAGADPENIPGDAFVPSFLNLFQARILNADIAYRLQVIYDTGDKATLIEDVLRQELSDAEREAALRRRAGYLTAPAGKIVTVNSFFTETSTKLTAALKTAYQLQQTHFPEFVAVPENTAGTPWLDLAKREKSEFWDGRDEATPEGKVKIVDYFKSTDLPTDVPLAWCGAFVAFCMDKSGSEKAARAIPKGSARAANWVNYGDRNLPIGSLRQLKQNQLQGAVVVLKRPPNSSSSGHVTLAIQAVTGADKIMCIGGNQGPSPQTVTIAHYNISRIRAVRVIDRDLPQADGDAVDVVARTLFGEARGETEAGKRAVANVIMNRVDSNRYPDTPQSVCQQKMQFSCWNPNDPNRAKLLAVQPGNPNFDKCLAVATEAVNGNIADLPPDVLHYHAESISAPKWVGDSPGATMIAKIGHHLFYSGIA